LVGKPFKELGLIRSEGVIRKKGFLNEGVDDVVIVCCEPKRMIFTVATKVDGKQRDFEVWVSESCGDKRCS
jgi:hypothetical protein